MSDLEDPQPRQIIGERGDGTYRLTLDGEEKIRVDVRDVDQENRFVARGGTRRAPSTGRWPRPNRADHCTSPSGRRPTSRGSDAAR